MLLGLLTLALLVRLPGMIESVWLDETFCSRVKIGPPVVLARTLLSDYHPPAYFLFQHLWIRLFGDGEVAIRLPALLSSVASVGVVWALACRIVGERGALLAGLLLALSPTHAWYAHEARPYATTSLVVLVAAYAWSRMREEGGRPWRWLFALSLGFGLLSHYFVLAYIGAFVVVAWLVGHPRRKAVTWIAVGLGVVFTGVFLTKAALSPIHTGSAYMRAFDLGEFWELHTNWFWTGNAFTPRLEPQATGASLLVVYRALAAGLAVLGVTRLLRTEGARGLAWPLVWIALPVLLLILPLVGLDRSYVERSALPALPFFLLLVAAGLDDLPGRVGCALRLAVPAAMVLPLVLVARRADQWTVYKPKPDWRAAAAWILERSGEGAPRDLLALEATPYALSYYDDRIQLAKVFEPNNASYRRLRGKLAGVVGEESSLVGWLDAGWRAELDRLEALRRGLRVGARELRAEDPLPELPAGTSSFLVYLPWQEAQRERAERWLATPRYEVERAHLDGIEVAFVRCP